ncbi:MAG: cell division protein ZapB [Eubacteriaceae bacterium]|nr:cell division protein ZapB [Eubacteriaceae bacterium]
MASQLANALEEKRTLSGENSRLVEENAKLANENNGLRAPGQVLKQPGQASIKVSSASEHVQLHFFRYQEFVSSYREVEETAGAMLELIVADAKKDNPGIIFNNEKNIVQVMWDLYEHTERFYIVLLDEWDCIFGYIKMIQSHRKNTWIFLGFGSKIKPILPLLI